MSLSDAIQIVSAACPNLTKRPLRSAAITYLNWWNGNGDRTAHSDPTGDKAVRRIIGYYDIEESAA